MALDGAQIVVAGTGAISVAPYGTALPDGSVSVRESLDSAFVDLGFTTEEGVSFSDGTSVTDLKAWQSLYPVRRLVAEYTGSIDFTLLQWNKDIWEQVVHGIVTEEVANVVHKFTPTRAGVVAEKSLIVDFDDGVEEYRLVVPRVGMASDIDIPLTSSDAANIPTSWGVIGGDSAGPWFLLTSDQSFSVD